MATDRGPRPIHSERADGRAPRRGSSATARSSSSASACRTWPATWPAALHAPNLVLIYESGAVGAEPERLPLSIGDPCLVTGALAVVSMAERLPLLPAARPDRRRLPGRRPDRPLRQPQHDRDRRLRAAEGAPARQRRRLRDRHQRPARADASAAHQARLPGEGRLRHQPRVTSPDGPARERLSMPGAGPARHHRPRALRLRSRRDHRREPPPWRHPRPRPRGTLAGSRKSLPRSPPPPRPPRPSSTSSATTSTRSGSISERRREQPWSSFITPGRQGPSFPSLGSSECDFLALLGAARVRYLHRTRELLHGRGEPLLGKAVEMSSFLHGNRGSRSSLARR